MLHSLSQPLLTDASAAKDSLQAQAEKNSCFSEIFPLAHIKTSQEKRHSEVY